MLNLDHRLGIVDCALAQYRYAVKMAESPVLNVRRVWAPYSQSCLAFLMQEVQELARILPEFLPRSTIHIESHVYRCDVALSRIDCPDHGWNQPLHAEPGRLGPCTSCLIALAEDAPKLLAKAQNPTAIAA
jgi:hypothetical protein